MGQYIASNIRLPHDVLTDYFNHNVNWT